MPAPSKKRRRVASTRVTKRQRATVLLLKSGESKFLDQTVDVTTISATGEIASASLVVLPQGNDDSERIGRKVTVTSIGMKYDVNLPKATDGNETADTIRLILYWDKQANGATATMATLLEDGTDWLSFRNLTETGRYVFLMDRTFVIEAPGISGNGTTTETGQAIHHDDFYKTVNIPIEYSGITGVIAQIRSNNIGLAVISRTGLADLDSVIRIRYTDA